jgi:acyl carrier protein
MENLEREITLLLIESLHLEGVTVAGIDPAAPLFGEGLGLDSIDALEIAMEIRKRYGVRTTADDARNREIFSSVRSLAGYVAGERARKEG